MGRPEKPFDADAGPVQRFAAELRALRAEAGGPTYRAMAQRSSYSPPALSQAAAGERLPTWAVTAAYVTACGGDAAAWEKRWQAAATEVAAVPRKKESSAESPYRGLTRFEPGDAEVFFGRDQLIDDLVELTREHRCAVVLGSSGSGKSSLLRAGLVPRLRQTSEPGLRPAAIRILTPGAHPARTHADRLRPAEGAGDTLVVVDQFEEVFTLCSDSAERARFIDLLLTAGQRGSRLRLVLGVRADFYGRCLEYPELVRVIGDASVPVGPMSRDDLRRAVVGPAGVRGLTVERALTAQLVDEVAGEPGGLPLLSHALLETWHRRSGRALTLRAYEAAGGVRGAIAQTAEDVYDTLTDAQATLARRIMLRLIAPGDGTADTCRPVDRSELRTAAGVHVHPGPAQDDRLPADPEHDAVLDRLARARLIILDGSTVHLAHEALITAWPRLRGWIEEDRHRLRVLRRLTQATALWGELDRDAGSLYRGVRLAEAEEAFGDSDHMGLTPDEREFLDASVAARTRERRRQRTVAGFASLLLVLTLIAGVVAWQQNRTSEHRRVDAAARRAATAAVDLRTSEPRTALQLSVAAWRLSPTPETRSALLGALGQDELPTFTPSTESKSTLRLSPDGRTLIDVGKRRVTLWDLRTHRRTGTYKAPRINDASSEIMGTSADGRYLLVPTDEGSQQRLWDIRAAHYQGRPIGPPEQAADLAAPADAPLAPSDSLTVQSTELNGQSFSNKALVTQTDDRMDVWDLRSGRHLLSRRFPGIGTVAGSDVSPDNRLLALCTTRGVLLWNMRTHRRADTAWRSRRTCGPDNGLQFTPDGRYLAVEDAYGLRRLTASTGKELPRLHQVGPQEVLFTPDGRYAVSRGSTDILIWRLDHPEAPVFRHLVTEGDPTDLRIDAHAHVLRYVEQAPGNKRTVHALDVSAALSPNWRAQALRQTVLSQDGSMLAVLRQERNTHRLSLFDGRTGRHLSDAPSPAPPPGDDADLYEPILSLSADGSRLAYGSGRLDDFGTPQGITVWDTRRHHRLTELHTDEPGSFMTFALSPDGHELRTADGEAGIIVRNASNGRKLRTIGAQDEGDDSGTGTEVGTAAADGRTLLMSDGALITTATGGTRHLAVGDCACVSALSDDGALIATTDLSGRITLWDARRHTSLGMLSGGLSDGAPGEREEITALAFSPDAATLAAAGSHGTLRLWDVNSRQELGTGLPTAGDNIVSLAFSPDGGTLRAAGTHVLLQSFDIAPEDAVTALCRRTTGALSPTHWNTYVRDMPYQRTCEGS
ncbi:hypothetical protein ACIRF8_31735 [Streptomyces sp. NPDC102406]|uniref:nSTAND1 domain-containing NTPase n=1 Tax=Streptomyces sp. NPDC102406 TaxID=3366171 RepID=UPI0037F9C592